MTAPPSQIAYWNGEVGERWAREAADLDAMISPLGELALGALDPQAGERIADIGCGAGATTRALARAVGAGGLVLGIDPSAPLLAAARARGGARYLEADAGSARPAEAPFDALFSRFGVMFFPDPVAAFAHLRTLVRPGGRIAFVCWRALRLNAWATLTLAAALPHLPEPPAPPEPGAPGPFAFADEDRLGQVLDASGWRDVVLTPADATILAGGAGADASAAARFMVKMGPAASAIREGGEALAERVAGDLAPMLAPHAGPDGVKIPAAVWIVTARA